MTAAAPRVTRQEVLAPGTASFHCELLLLPRRYCAPCSCTSLRTGLVLLIVFIGILLAGGSLIVGRRVDAGPKAEPPAAGEAAWARRWRPAKEDEGGGQACRRRTADPGRPSAVQSARGSSHLIGGFHRTAGGPSLRRSASGGGRFCAEGRFHGGHRSEEGRCLVRARSAGVPVGGGKGKGGNRSSAGGEKSKSRSRAISESTPGSGSELVAI